MCLRFFKRNYNINPLDFILSSSNFQGLHCRLGSEVSSLVEVAVLHSTSGALNLRENVQYLYCTYHSLVRFIRNGYCGGLVEGFYDYYHMIVVVRKSTLQTVPSFIISVVPVIATRTFVFVDPFFLETATLSLAFILSSFPAQAFRFDIVRLYFLQDVKHLPYS